MASENLSIALQATLNKSTSVLEINKAIKELESDPRLQKIKINLELNSKILDSLTKYNRTIIQITQSIQAQSYVVNSHTNTINNQTQALKEAVEALIKYNAEKQKAIGAPDTAKAVKTDDSKKSGFVETAKSEKEVADFIVTASSLPGAFTNVLSVIGLTNSRLDYFSTKLRAYMLTLGLGTVATRVFAASIMGITKAFLPLAIISGVTFAITKFVEMVQKQKSEEKALVDQQQVIANNWYTQQEKIKSLVAEYNVLNAVKLKSQIQEERYLEISNQLSSLMPNLVASVDQKGLAHLKNAEAIEKELTYAEKLSALENGKKIVDSKSNITDTLNERSKLKNKIIGIDWSIKSGYGTGPIGNSVKLSESEIMSFKMQKIGLEQQVSGLTSKLKDDMSSTISLMSGLKPNSSANDSLKTYMNNLDMTNINQDEAVKKMLNIGNALKNIKSLQSSNILSPESEIAYANALGVVQKELDLTDNELQDFNNNLNNVNPSTDKAKDGTEGLADRLKKLNADIGNSEGSLSSLASAYDKLQNGEQLSSNEILMLSADYPELLNYLSEHNGKLEDQGDILNWVANQARLKSLSDAQLLLDDVRNTQEALETKRKMFKQFYGEMVQNGTVDAWAIGSTGLSGEEQARLDDKEKQKKLIQLQIDLLSKPIDLGTYGKHSDKNTSPDKDFQKYNVDVYKNKLRDLDTQLKESELIMTRYTDTSVNYRNELTKQSNISKEKVELTTQEKDKLRAAITDLEARVSSTTDKKKENELIQELDQTESKLADLTNAGLDYQLNVEQAIKQITQSLEKESLTQTEDLIKTLDKNIGVFESKINKLKTAMSSLKNDPTEKISIQADLIQTYTVEQEQIIKNVAALNKQSQSLEVNSEAWQKVQDEIKKYGENYTQINKDLYSITEKIATETVDTMKKAISAQLEAENRLHDKKIKNLDEQIRKQDEATNAAIEALDRQQQAQDYDKLLSKDQAEAQNIQNEINAYSLDNSNEGKAKVIELKEKLAEAQAKIDDEQQKRSNDLVKQRLQDANKAYKADIDNQKSAEDEKFKVKEDALNLQLNNDAHWLSVEKDLINGHTADIQEEMKGLIEGLGKYAMDNLGIVDSQAAKIQSIINQLNGASTQVSQLSNPKVPTTGVSGSYSSEGTELSWQEKLAKAAVDDNYAERLIKDAQSKYDQYKKDKLMDKANAAHVWADQVRAANPNIGAQFPAYMTGGLNTSAGLAKLDGTASNPELVLSSSDTSNLLKVVNLTRDIIGKLNLFTPDFSKIMSGASTGSNNNVNLTLNNTFTGDNQGEQTLRVIANGIKRLGFNFNQ